jgi:hypothetical protein
MQATDTDDPGPADADETGGGPLWAPDHAECSCWSSTDGECPWRT